MEKHHNFSGCNNTDKNHYRDPFFFVWDEPYAMSFPPQGYYNNNRGLFGLGSHIRGL